jgi:dethiobiotin synthetase
VKAFITGTDTAVGKTYATALLTRALRRAGLDTVALKPVCCGDRDDAEILRDAVDDELSLEEVNPFWLKTPVAPLVASRLENIPLPVDLLLEKFHAVTKSRQSYLIEGAGGWLVPLADGLTMADFAIQLALPVIVVVANRLGCINHTLLTLESIRASGLTCSGLILNTLTSTNDDATRTNREMLVESAGVPILLEISPGQTAADLAIA